MKSINIFCFGFGQVAKNFIEKINREKIDINLSTTSRQKTNIRKFDQINYTSYQLNEDNFDQEIKEKIKNSDYILISIPPIKGTDLVIKNFSKEIENCSAKWMTYLSATSVYGDHNGEWVDEESVTKPTSLSGITRLKAEKSWISLAKDKNISLQVFRLSGIYSNNSNVLLRLKAGNVNLVNKKNHFFSRIHVEDIANILFKSLSSFRLGEIYNISDDKPSPSEDVTLYGVKLLNIDKPKIIDVKDIKSEMLKNFYCDSKKVSNKKMKNFFNYSLKFPTYEEGLNYAKDNLI
jgi:dTDP-4-dehydrorhamnose reductase|tara:strand:+ start:1088 stop:1963 length:876 start_codon:yes stop_codon:yes gene_type:complete